MSETSNNQKVYVHLKHGLDAERYRTRYRDGQEPDETPYGFHQASSMGFTVLFSQDHHGRLENLLRKVLLRIFWFDLIHAWRNRQLIKAADVVWTMLEREAFAIGFLMKLRLVPRRPLIANAVWILDRWDTFPGRTQRLYRSLLKECVALTVHSQHCLTRAQSIFPEVHSELMYFGISTDTFVRRTASPSGEPITIVAAGNDVTRDWETLIDAFGNDPRFRLVIICKWLDRSLLKKFSQLVLPEGLSMKEFYACYREADFIAVPMHSNIYSGITVALEAVAMGVPVLSSDTGGVSTYFAPGEVLYAPVQDAAAMKLAVLSTTPAERHAMVDRAWQKFKAHDYSTIGLMRRYADLTHRVLNAR